MPAKAAWVLHDDPPTLGMIRSLLASEGYDVTSVDSPFRALASVGAAPSLVLLGLAAIDDRDLELVTILRRRWPAARLLVLFPAILRERAARTLELGADGYLPEPFYAAELSAMARAAAVAATEVPRRAAAEAPANDTAPANRSSDDDLSKLAAGVAHTIRNPLQILELQLGSYETDGKADVDGMREQLRRIATVVESLTRFSGRRKLNTRLIDVNALVQRVHQPGRAGGGPLARLDLAPERLEVLGAPDLLRAAMDAIRQRAERSTPPDREIEVETRAAEDAGSPVVEICVTDGGPALSPGELDAFFDPFPDGDQLHVHDGSGLELAAAAGVIRNHGGTVAAIGAGSSGTTVVVRLPARGRQGAGRED